MHPGSSARARVRLQQHEQVRVDLRFIRACAGATRRFLMLTSRTHGSSARARVRRPHDSRRARARRFIRACAGATLRSTRTWKRHLRHQRLSTLDDRWWSIHAHAGTSSPADSLYAQDTDHPRARVNNSMEAVRDGRRLRHIHAHVGTTRPGEIRGYVDPVHPRVRGSDACRSRRPGTTAVHPRDRGLSCRTVVGRAPISSVCAP